VSTCPPNGLLPAPQVDDGESDSEGDYDMDGVDDDEIDEVGAALWDHHQTIYRVFDAYASLGSSSDAFHISANGFNQFVTDCRIAVKGHKFCSKTHVDQLFLLVNSKDGRSKQQLAEKAETQKELIRRGSTKQALLATQEGRRGSTLGVPAQPDTKRKASAAPEQSVLAVDGAPAMEKPAGRRVSVAAPPDAARHRDSLIASLNADTGANHNTRALNRNEFFQCLIRLAIMRYVQPGLCTDVSEAVHELFLSDIEPNLESSCQQDSNEFRKAMCYIAETDEVLHRHEKSIKAIFKEYASGDGNILNKKENELMGYGEWQHFVKDLGLINADFSQREATLCFVWSRMRSIDESHPKTAIKVSNLSLEDFYDALTRVATMMTLPTDEEVKESGFSDAGTMYLDLLGKGERQLNAWNDSCAEAFEVKQEEQRKKGEPVSEQRQPVWRALDALLHIIIRTIETATQGADDLNVTAKEIKSFRASGRSATGRRGSTAQ